jgi:hypothetical protein
VAKNRKNNFGKLVTNFVIMGLMLFLFVAWDIWMVYNIYLPVEFEGVRTWHLQYAFIVISTSFIIALIRKSAIMFLLPIWYAFGWADILYYMIERGHLPERFWGVWIVMLGQYEPLAADVIWIAKIGIILTLCLIPFWPIGDDGCVIMALYKKFKRVKKVHDFNNGFKGIRG